LEQREHALAHAANRIAPDLAEAERLAAVVASVERRIATLLEREHLLTQTAERIATGLADADRLAAVTSDVETRIATLEAREHALGHAADRIAPGLADVDRLAAAVSSVETRIAVLEEREHALAHAAVRIAPSLAEADRLATVVSGVETRIATLLAREHLLTRTAERIVAGLAEVGRLAAVVSRVKTRIAALLARDDSLPAATGPIVGQPVHHRAVEPAAPLPLVSVPAARSKDDGSRLGEPKRTVGRLTIAAGVAGLLALVAAGSGLVARWARPAIPAAVTQPASEAQSAAAASIPVLSSPAVDGTTPPAPTLLATAEPMTPSVTPAATASASKVRTQRRARTRQLAGESTAPPVFTGALAVESNPAGGAVFLDRQRVGTTPLRLTGVAAGAHVIWIESRGHARWTASVQVNTGKVVRVRATLQPQR
jgi:cell division protein FtsB